MDGTALGNVVDLADRCGLTAVRLPRINELNRAAQADAALDVSPIAIEDLLGRPQTVLDRAAMDELVRGRRVLVTGAGGSIAAGAGRGSSGRSAASASTAARMMLAASSDSACASVKYGSATFKPL